MKKIVAVSVLLCLLAAPAIAGERWLVQTFVPMNKPDHLPFEMEKNTFVAKEIYLMDGGSWKITLESGKVFYFPSAWTWITPMGNDED